MVSERGVKSLVRILSSFTNFRYFRSSAR